MLVDSHCHFMDLPNPKEALKQAAENGVQRIVSNGVDLESNLRNLEASNRFPPVFACVGLHPKECLEQTEAKNQKTIDWIQQQSEKNGIVGIGEIGLDFWIAKTAEQQKRQQRWFEKQLVLAAEFEKPVSIHARNAHSAAFNFVQKNGIQKALFHWFDGNENEWKTVCENGFFVSIGPAVFSQKKIQLLAQQVPLENLLLETDCPVSFNGKPSQPFWVRMVAQKIAEMRKEPFETVAEQTTQNAQQFFGWKKRE